MEVLSKDIRANENWKTNEFGSGGDRFGLGTINNVRTRVASHWLCKSGMPQVLYSNTNGNVKITTVFVCKDCSG